MMTEAEQRHHNREVINSARNDLAEAGRDPKTGEHLPGWLATMARQRALVHALDTLLGIEYQKQSS